MAGWLINFIAKWSKTKKTYVADGERTQCVHGILELLDNEYLLFRNTGPHLCKHGLGVFDAKIFSRKVTKTHNRIEIDPGMMTADVSSVYASVSAGRVERKLQQAKEANTSFKESKYNLQTPVHMDFPGYAKHDFIGPEEASRQTDLYIQDLSLQKT